MSHPRTEPGLLATATPSAPPAPDRVLRVIALYKFAKAALLVAVALGALRLLDPETAARAQRWLTALAATTDRKVVQRLIALGLGLSPGKLEALGSGAFLFASLFTVEGVGLWRGKHWAEYLTVIATTSLVPLELYHLARGITLPRIAAVVLNVAVVAYLVYALRRHHIRRAAEQRDP